MQIGTKLGEKPSLVAAGRPSTKAGRDVLEGNRIRLRAARVVSDGRKGRGRRKPDSAAGCKGRQRRQEGTWSKETRFSCALQGSSAMAGRDVVEGNLVQLRARKSSAKVGT